MPSASCPVLAITSPRVGTLVHPVLERAADPGDGERLEEGIAEIAVGESRLEQRDHRRGGQPVEPGEPGAVGQPNPGERHARLAERGADHTRPGGRRPDAGVGRSELLDEHLGRVVVALAAHEPDDVRQRLGDIAREGQPGGREHAGAGSAADPDARRLERLSQQRPRGERGARGRAAAVPAAIDGEGGERRRLVDVEARPPAGRRPACVEPGLVRNHSAVDASNPPGRRPPPRARPGRPASASGRRIRAARGLRARRRRRALPLPTTSVWKR